MTREMVTYYVWRAAEYDEIYALPQWQRDLETLRRLVSACFEGRRVFEVACGTGYWTQFAARGRAPGRAPTSRSAAATPTRRVPSPRRSMAASRRSGFPTWISAG